MKTTDALVVAAGQSRRMRGKENKVLLPLGGMPVLVYSLRILEASPLIRNVWVVVRPVDVVRVERIIREYALGRAEDRLVQGGRERFESVRNGLAAIAEHQAPDLVVVHDGARPFLNPAVLEQGIAMAGEKGACVVGYPSPDSLKETLDGQRVSGTVDRSSTWLVQTPQVFEFRQVWEAYRNWDVREGIPTDDTAVVEAAGYPVSLLHGDRWNVKITTRADFCMAEALIEKRTIPWLPYASPHLPR